MIMTVISISIGVDKKKNKVKYYRSFFTYPSISLLVTVGENLSTTFPSLSIKNFVKFQLISLPGKTCPSSASFSSKPAVASLVTSSGFCSLRYLKSGSAFSPFTSSFSKFSKVTP